MITEAEYRTQVAEAFHWLVARGFAVEVTDYGALGHIALLTDHRRWVRVAFETREDAVLLDWGDYLGPGTFNDDPFRNPRPLRDLLPRVARTDLSAAGAVAGDEAEPVRAALLRVSELVEHGAADRLWAEHLE